LLKIENNSRSWTMRLHWRSQKQNLSPYPSILNNGYKQWQCSSEKEKNYRYWV